MSYQKQVVVHKVTQDTLDRIYREFPLTDGAFNVIDTLDFAQKVAKHKTNKKLPGREVVSGVVEAYEDTEHGVYHFTLEIMD